MSKDIFATTIQTLPEGFLDTLPQVFCRFCRVGQDIRFEYVSQAVQDWTGREPETFLAEDFNWLDSVHPSDRQVLLDATNRSISHDDRFVADYRIIDAAGNVRYIRHTARFVPAGEGQVQVWNGCMEDVTPLRQTQQDMERSQLLQNMGRLVAGIAHEINTPIQFIGDNLHFLEEAWSAISVLFKRLAHKMSPEDKEAVQGKAGTENIDFFFTEVPEAIRQSLEGVDRVSGLVSAMRDFSRLDERRMASADLNRAVRSTLTLLRNELKYTADVQTELDTSLPEVYCSIDEISRVLLNLLINAGHSVKEKIDKGLCSRGTICVRTRRIDQQVEISIADTGMGIPEDIRQRIFERFFTTKRNTQSQGTGQGLAMARSIVEERHHGRIWFETHVGEGTTFFLSIPIGSQRERTAP